MRVAAVQFKPDKTQLVASRERLVALTRRAAKDCDLVVLPEMAITGYIFPDAAAVRAVAEPATGPTFQALSVVAAEAQCWIVGGFAEIDGTHLYNSAWIIDRTGTLRFVYRKTLLFESDEHWATPGNSGYAQFDTGAGTFGVGICMDLNDDAFVCWCADTPLTAIAFPTNWLDQGTDVWPYWAWRLEASPAALVAANTYGFEGEVLFHGRSVILEQRQVLASAPAEGDGIIRAVVGQRR